MIAITTLFRVIRILRVGVLYKHLEDSLPGSFMNALRKFADSYAFFPLVVESELIPQYRRSLKFLTRYLGARPLGDYLEFGVGHGTSMLCMHKTLRKLKFNRVRLFGFDSFEGLPPHDDHHGPDPHSWKPGDYACSMEKASGFLTRNGVDWKRTFLIKGWYHKALVSELKEVHQIKKASIIMIDCDIYPSAKASLDFCASLIKDTSVIFFDDWPSEYRGEARAFDEFLKENQHFRAEKYGSYKPYGQIFLVTNTNAY